MVFPAPWIRLIGPKLAPEIPVFLSAYTSLKLTQTETIKTRAEKRDLNEAAEAFTVKRPGLGRKAAVKSGS